LNGLTDAIAAARSDDVRIDFEHLKRMTLGMPASSESAGDVLGPVGPLMATLTAMPAMRLRWRTN